MELEQTRSEIVLNGGHKRGHHFCFVKSIVTAKQVIQQKILPVYINVCIHSTQVEQQQVSSAKKKEKARASKEEEEEEEEEEQPTKQPNNQPNQPTNQINKQIKEKDELLQQYLHQVCPSYPKSATQQFLTW